MGKLSRYVMIVSALALFSGLAQANIVADAWNRADNRDRCGGRAVPAGECEAAQLKGKTDCGLTDAEFEWSRANALIPFCPFARFVAAVCPCGCFEASTPILTIEEGAAAWTKAKDVTAATSVVAVAPDARREAMKFGAQGVAYVTRGAEERPLVEVVLEDGRKLAVTEHHAVVLGDGRVVAASEVKAGDALLDQNGKGVAVRKVARVATDAPVFNFLVQGDSSHLVVANGLVVGDILWQSTLQSELGQVKVRQ